MGDIKEELKADIENIEDGLILEKIRIFILEILSQRDNTEKCDTSEK